MRKWFFGILIVALAVLFVVIDSIASPQFEDFSDGTVVIGSHTFSVAVADTGDERVRGLSGRKKLPEDTGMLFIFPDDDFHGIWMKDMHFPIDIAWIDEGGRIITIKEGATPESYPESFTPEAPTRFVLEVPAGTFRTRGISAGDMAGFSVQVQEE